MYVCMYVCICQKHNGMGVYLSPSSREGKGSEVKNEPPSVLSFLSFFVAWMMIRSSSTLSTSSFFRNWTYSPLKIPFHSSHVHHARPTSDDQPLCLLHFIRQDLLAYESVGLSKSQLFLIDKLYLDPLAQPKINKIHHSKNMAMKLLP